MPNVSPAFPVRPLDFDRSPTYPIQCRGLPSRQYGRSPPAPPGGPIMSYYVHLLTRPHQTSLRWAGKHNIHYPPVGSSRPCNSPAGDVIAKKTCRAVLRSPPSRGRMEGKPTRDHFAPLPATGTASRCLRCRPAVAFPMRYQSHPIQLHPGARAQNQRQKKSPAKKEEFCTSTKKNTN